MAAEEAGNKNKPQRMVDELGKAADVTYTAKVPVSRLSYGELPGVGEERKLPDGDAQPLIVERTGAGDTLALADGYHRLEGMILNGETEVTVIILNSKDSDAVSGLSEQREFRRIQEEHKGESADPVTRDDAGNVIPLSQRFNPADDRITYSLRPGDFDSRVEAMFSPFQRSPEARLIMTRVARRPRSAASARSRSRRPG